MASAPEFVSATPAVAIRPMREADVPAVAEVERSAYAFPWSVGIFRDCLRVGYVCRVVELEGRVIGHGILSMGAGEAHILNLCVQAEYRCLGVGRRLLTLLIDIARGAGMTDDEAMRPVEFSNRGARRIKTVSTQHGGDAGEVGLADLDHRSEFLAEKGCE